MWLYIRRLLVATALMAAALVAIPPQDVLAAPSCNGKAATKVGSAGRDTIVGTSNAEVIVAGGGHDRVMGKGGSDLICGAGGNDAIDGQRGQDAARRT